MSLKLVEKKKLLGRYDKKISVHTFAKWLFNSIIKNVNAASGGFYKKTVFKSFVIFTGKHTCVGVPF